MRILGLDYGRKRIGVAISDALGITAQSLPTIHSKSAEDALLKIAEILCAYEVELIVIGYPLSLKGEVNRTTKRVDRFIAAMELRFGLPVETMDERMTSVQARRIMQQMGSSPSRSKAKIDQIAASLILQTYLDRQGIAG